MIVNISNLNYVYRNDVSGSFENDIINWLDKDDIALLGFPGVGKSSLVRAIAAKFYKNKPVVILSIDRTTNSSFAKIELIKIDNSWLPIPVVTVSSSSTKGEDLLKVIVNSLDSIHKYLEKFAKYTDDLKNAVEDLERINKIKETLGNILQSIPEEPLEFVKVISQAAPYVNLILKTSQAILTLRREKKLERLEKNEMLVLVDDLADLRPNWEILSNLLSYNFRYLFVIRVEKPSDYISMLTDNLFVNDYLEKSGIPVSIKKKYTLPPPSLEVFNAIMQSQGVNHEKIHELWRYSGGIPATALMMWFAPANFEQMLKSVKSMLTDNSLEFPWKERDVEMRLAYTFRATKAIYGELRNNNYSYVALVSQPWGVTADELALFCGYKFRKIYTSNVNHVKEVYELLSGNQHDNIEIVEWPYGLGGNCSYLLNESIVEKYSEANTETYVNFGEILHKPLPTISGGDGRRNVYRLNNLFKHIQILIEEIAKDDQILRDELTSAKKILLQIMDKESRFGCTTQRIVYCSVNHLLEIEDLSDVQNISLKWMWAICEQFALEGLGILKTLEEKLFNAKVPVRTLCELDLALYCYSLTILARRTYSPWLLDISYEHILRYFVEYNDRRALVFVALSMANMAFKSREEATARLTSAKNFVEWICKNEDSVCLYARTNLYIKLIDFFSIEQNYEYVENLLKKAEDGQNRLTAQLNTDDLNWMQGSGFNLQLDIFRSAGELNTFYGNFLYDTDRISEAIEKYKKSVSIHEKIGAISNVSEFRALISRSKLMNCENDFKVCLNELALLDRDILEWEKQESSELNLFTSIELSYTHTAASLARIAAEVLYEEKSLITFEPLISQNTRAIPRNLAMLRAGSTFLVKLFNGICDIRKFLGEALRYMASRAEDQRSIPRVALAMYEAMEKNMDYLERNENGKIERVTLSEVTQSLINEQDRLGISNNFYLQKCCKPYRSLSPDGILAEVVCIGILTEMASEGGRNMAIGIAFHLLYDDYESAQFIIQIIIQNTKSPLQQRILRDLQNALTKYKNLNRTCICSVYRIELAQAYLKLWYFTL
jgi:tetratricopeptide (TPR) repeat protein